MLEACSSLFFPVFSFLLHGGEMLVAQPMPAVSECKGVLGVAPIVVDAPMAVVLPIVWAHLRLAGGVAPFDCTEPQRHDNHSKGGD